MEIESSANSTIYGFGHLCVLSNNGHNYILYHRIFPQKESYVLRQLCLDSLNFDTKGNIEKVNPQEVTSLINK